MKRKTFFVLAIIIALTSLVFAQSAATSGTVRPQRFQNARLVIRTNLSAAMIRVQSTASGQASTSFINRNDARSDYESRGRFDQAIPHGHYTITITADGYETESINITLSGNQSMRFELKPSIAKLTIRIPRHSFSRGSVPHNQVSFFIDGELLRGGPSWDIRPGRRKIRIESGALQLEETFHFEPGREYLIEPKLSLEMK